MRKLLFIGLSFLFFLSPHPAQASTEFKVDYVVDYNFNDVGASTVTKHISLTNRSSAAYATSYQLRLTGETPQNISGTDAGGPLKIVTTTTQGDSLITVTFNQPVVGKGNTLHFDLTYNSLPATHNGQIWEITLPRLTDPDEVDNYALNLTIPPAFGQPAFISPPPDSASNRTYSFTKDQIAKVGIVASFGNLQNYSFTLKYHLAYPDTVIALPPDTGYQKMVYSSIVPPPADVQADADGNWLALYHLKPRQEIDITAIGQVRILSQPAQTLFSPSPEQLKDSTRPSKFWQTADPQIQALAKIYTTPQAIYNFVVTTLVYDYNRISPSAPRNGALSALSTPTQSLCTDFTDLFIAIARAANIPAREVEGYAYSTDPQLQPLTTGNSILHAWPEYWDGSQWIAIDPTWANTSHGVDYFSKMDFYHFAFVVHGHSSSDPAPVRQIQVAFAPYQDSVTPPLDVSWRKPWQLFPFYLSSNPLVITNNQHQALYRIPITLAAENLDLVSPSIGNIDQLPPYGHYSFGVSLRTPFLPDYRSKFIHFGVGPQHITYNIGTEVYLAWQILLGVFISLIIVALGLSTHHAWSVYHESRKRADSLRGQSPGPP